MPKKQLPSIAQTAHEVLQAVRAEQQVKTAELQIVRNVLSPISQTETGQDLLKLAEECKQATDTPQVTYADLHDFMARCDAN